MTDPQTLAALLVDRAAQHPQHRFGVVAAATSGPAPTDLAQALDLAARAAATFADLGVRPGTRVALIGVTSPSYLIAWTALQLAGAEAALVNPTYPVGLLDEMLRPLGPSVVMWIGRDVDRRVAPGARHIDATDLAGGTLSEAGAPTQLGPREELPGCGRQPTDIAGWMHTSGTTGTPKFCAQTHEYSVRLGRFVADRLALSEQDTVLAPLPLFHINPLGYGVIGGLVGHSSVLGWERFSARAFWPLLRELAATVCILHAPPIEILKRATTAADAAGHRLRAVLYADLGFLDEFSVPLGLSVYGSTEAGGLSHTWTWRRGERTHVLEGAARYGGCARPDLRWDVAEDGEILVADRRPGALFSGYARAGGVESAIASDGWFHTGDLGRIDEHGNLVFVERAGEAIRVKGEFVPIGYVEEHLRAVAGLGDFALWRRPSELVDHEIVVYLAAAAVPVDALVAAAVALPSFMRPVAVLRVDGPLPRDTGVGKVQRRALSALTVVEECRLEYGER